MVNPWTHLKNQFGAMNFYSMSTSTSTSRDVDVESLSGGAEGGGHRHLRDQRGLCLAGHHVGGSLEDPHGEGGMRNAAAEPGVFRWMNFRTVKRMMTWRSWRKKTEIHVQMMFFLLLAMLDYQPERGSTLFIEDFVEVFGWLPEHSAHPPWFMILLPEQHAINWEALHVQTNPCIQICCLYSSPRIPKSDFQDLISIFS